MVNKRDQFELLRKRALDDAWNDRLEWWMACPLTPESRFILEVGRCAVTWNTRAEMREALAMHMRTAIEVV